MKLVQGQKVKIVLIAGQSQLPTEYQPPVQERRKPDQQPASILWVKVARQR